MTPHWNPCDFAELGDHFVNRSHFIRHLLKLAEREGLRAVGKRFLRLTVHFDHQAIGPNRNAGACKGRDHEPTRIFFGSGDFDSSCI